jgi:WhiB family redox-sensing transcriptional regulator
MALDWRQYAACKDLDPDLFFPEQGPVCDEVKAACDRCPVLIRCTFEALRKRGHGYQAGMYPQERNRVRAWDRRVRQANAPARPVAPAPNPDETRHPTAVRQMRAARERAEKYFGLLTQGLTREEARAQLGISIRTADRYEAARQVAA